MAKKKKTPARSLHLVVRHAGKLLHVRAGGECPVPRPRHDDRADAGVGVRCGSGGRQVPHHDGGERVELRGAVDGQEGDAGGDAVGRGRGLGDDG